MARLDSQNAPVTRALPATVVAETVVNPGLILGW